MMRIANAEPSFAITCSDKTKAMLRGVVSASSYLEPLLGASACAIRVLPGSHIASR